MEDLHFVSDDGCSLAAVTGVIALLIQGEEWVEMQGLEGEKGVLAPFVWRWVLACGGNRRHNTPEFREKSGQGLQRVGGEETDACTSRPLHNGRQQPCEVQMQKHSHPPASPVHLPP